MLPALTSKCRDDMRKRTDDHQCPDHYHRGHSEQNRLCHRKPAGNQQRHSKRDQPSPVLSRLSEGFAQTAGGLAICIVHAFVLSVSTISLVSPHD